MQRQTLSDRQPEQHLTEQLSVLFPKHLILELVRTGQPDEAAIVFRDRLETLIAKYLNNN